MPERLYVVSEDRQVEVADGAIADSFETYAAHIYTTDESVADRDTLQSVQTRIAEDDAARKKPGNLAFEDSGVEIEISSGARYGNIPARVVDGIETAMGWRADHTDKGEKWLALHWPQEQTIGRVVIYTGNVLAAEVQAPAEAEGEWRTLAEVTGEERLEGSFDAVTTDTIRIMVNEVTEDARGASIQEVEAYAQ
jgi:hypothetical protein